MQNKREPQKIRFYYVGVVWHGRIFTFAYNYDDEYHTRGDSALRRYLNGEVRRKCNHLVLRHLAYLVSAYIILINQNDDIISIECLQFSRLYSLWECQYPIAG